MTPPGSFHAPGDAGGRRAVHTHGRNPTPWTVPLIRMRLPAAANHRCSLWGNWLARQNLSNIEPILRVSPDYRQRGGESRAVLGTTEAREPAGCRLLIVIGFTLRRVWRAGLRAQRAIGRQRK